MRGGFSKDRDQQLLAELTDLARNGPKISKVDAVGNAEQRWQTVRGYPYLAIGALLFLSTAGAGILCRIGTIAYPALAVTAVGFIYGVVRLNQTHRKAFVERERAGGMSERDAIKLYESKYSSD